MLPLLLGIGVTALLIKAFSGDDSRSESSNKPKKLFISFAIEDQKYRDFLVGQSKRENSPFDFIDMSAKQPWAEAIWQQKCREKIRKCDGVIVLLSRNTYRASGARWEIKCAKEEGIPIIGMHIKKNDKGATPPELKGKKIITWSWDNLEEVINDKF